MFKKAHIELCYMSIAHQVTFCRASICNRDEVVLKTVGGRIVSEKCKTFKDMGQRACPEYELSNQKSKYDTDSLCQAVCASFKG